MKQAKVQPAHAAILSILSEESQEIVRLNLAEDVPCSEIAKIMHLPLDHVRDVMENYWILMLARAA